MERNVVALSTGTVEGSEIWLVEKLGASASAGFECRKCRLVGENLTTLPDAATAVLHLRSHAKARHAGAAAAIDSLTRCPVCRGSGKTKSQRVDVMSTPPAVVVEDVPCPACDASGRNELGRK